MNMSINRREFLKRTGLALGAGSSAALAQAAKRVSMVLDPSDPTAPAAPARWAAKELQEALAAHGVAVGRRERLEQAGADDLCILAAGLTAPARGILKSVGGSAPEAAESLALVAGKAAGRSVLLASGRDVRGLVYALLELTARVRNAENPLGALEAPKPVMEQPANRIRSITRCFVSDVEDKSWYNDRSMWPRYLSMLAAQRFNRFNLTLGIGYDFPRDITDCYFHFAYPFLLSLPGDNVRAVGLPDAERDRNLEMLRFISDETAARGLQFQLGLRPRVSLVARAQLQRGVFVLFRVAAAAVVALAVTTFSTFSSSWYLSFTFPHPTTHFPQPLSWNQGSVGQRALICLVLWRAGPGRGTRLTPGAPPLLVHRYTGRWRG